MTKYFYIKYKGYQGELTTADKLKRAVRQIEALFKGPTPQLIKAVEISKEKYDRLILWGELKKRQRNETSVNYLKRLGIITASMSGFTNNPYYNI